MNAIQRTIDWFDQLQRRRKLLGFPLAVLKKYGDDQAGHQAALLAYYAFLAIFPLLLVLTTVVKVLVRGDDALSHKIINGATQYFPVVGDELQRNVHSLGGSAWILAIGVVLTLFGARGVADILRNGINHVWQVPRYSRSGFPHNFLKSFATIAVGGAGLLLAPIISGYAVTVGGHGWLARLIALLITLGILYLMFLTLVKIALPTRVPVSDLRPAAIISTIGLALLQVAGSYILTHQLRHFNSLYGTFAVVLGLLFWLYLQAQLFFYALEVASVRALGLWPRALDQARLTAQDKKALRLYVLRNKFYAGSKISVVTEDKS
jgi:YihY family inner membrane protein